MTNPDDLEALRESIVHGLRMRGWSRVDAECEALARLERIAIRARAKEQSGE